MTLFPFFIDIKDKPGLIIGNGKHALEKVERMLPYGPRLTVIAPEFLPEIEAIAEREETIVLERRAFTEADLEREWTFVIAAGHNREENHRIAALCKQKKILVNVGDDQPACQFVFPSLIAQGSLSIGICTAGASPSAGIYLKKQMEELIPDRIEEILDWLQSKRPVIRKAIPDGKQRFAFYHTLSEICMEENRPLGEEEFLELLYRQIAT